MGSSKPTNRADDSRAYPYMDVPAAQDVGESTMLFAMISAFAGTLLREMVYALVAIVLIISVFANSTRMNVDYKQMITTSVLALSTVGIVLFVPSPAATAATAAITGTV